MKLLKIGISGVRGIVGESLTPLLAMDFAAAFGTYVRARPVLVGRDTRITSSMLRAACVASLLSTGCDVFDLGICATPILQYMIRKARAHGGISITAGHNDIRWNALSFVNRDGTSLNPFQGAEVLDIFHLKKFHKSPADRLGRLELLERAEAGYFEALGQYLDVDAIREARLKVVIDACNGAGSLFLETFARTLGFELIPVNNEPNGFFPHDPEPRPRNAQQVVSVLKAIGADVGFLLNSDVGRVSIVAETGESLSEEYTFPLVAVEYLKRRCGPIVTNASTSRMVEDVARTRGCPIVRTKVGQSYAVQALIHEDAVLAGEGSGGVAIPDFQPAFDAFLTMGFILETAAKEGKKISRLIEELPRYHIVKEKIYCPPARVHTIVSEVQNLFKGREIDTSDGVRVDDINGWVHVRTSATEPLIRIIAEDRTRERARRRTDEVAKYLRLLIP
jgi:phosphomannomutase